MDRPLVDDVAIGVAHLGAVVERIAHPGRDGMCRRHDHGVRHARRGAVARRQGNGQKRRKHGESGHSGEVLHEVRRFAVF